MKKLAVLALALALPLAVNAETFEPGTFEVVDTPFVQDPIPQNVKNYVDQKFQEAKPDIIGMLNVNDTGFDIVNDGYATLSVSLEEIKSHSGGSEVTLGVVNWMGVTLTGVKFNVGVRKSNELGVVFQDASISELRPGKEVLLKFRVSTKPDEIETVDFMFLGSNGIRYAKAE